MQEALHVRVQVAMIGRWGGRCKGMRRQVAADESDVTGAEACPLSESTLVATEHIYMH